MPRFRIALTGLLGAVVLTTAGCTAASPTPTVTATPTAHQHSEVTPTRAPSSATPSVTPTPTTAASATPTRTPTPGGGPVSSVPPPAGYLTSCAKDVPWGRQVTKPFVCLDAPVFGAHVSGGEVLEVRGYAGGSFESNVVVEVRPLEGATLAQQKLGERFVFRAVTYAAPDVGMPGAFRVMLIIPQNPPYGPARVIAHFDSPQDGSVVAQATVDIHIH